MKFSWLCSSSKTLPLNDGIFVPVMGLNFFPISDNSFIKMIAKCTTCHLKWESQSAVQFHFLYPGSGQIQPFSHNVVEFISVQEQAFSVLQNVCTSSWANPIPYLEGTAPPPPKANDGIRVFSDLLLQLVMWL